jgi:flagellar secretion chaperone FliS
MNSVVNTAIAQYRKLNIQTSVDDASPHKLIDMLLEGARARLMRARGCIQHGDIEGRSKAISATVAILEGLQASLDHDKGGELAGNLDALYDYMQRRLFRANVDNDVGGIDEVVGLVDTLHEAWSAIGDQVPQRRHA